MDFNPENRFFSFMSLLGDLILLNVLFLFTSLPVVTIGPSCCELYLSVRKRLENKESYIVRDYMKAWKENFVNGICIWIVFLAALILMAFFSSYIASHLTNLPAIVLYLIIFIWLSFSLLYAFPLQATFINTPWRIILNSFLTALRHLTWTIPLFLATYLPLTITLVFPNALGLTLVYWAFIGCSLCAVFSVLILRRVLVFYLPKDPEAE